MLKKFVKKLALIALCFAVALPIFNLNLGVAKADSAYALEEYVYVGVGYGYDIEKPGYDAELNKIKISAKSNFDSDFVAIYENGNDCNSADNYEITFTRATVDEYARVSITVRKVGNVEIKAVADGANEHLVKLTVVDSIDKIRLSYIDRGLSANNSAFELYESKIDETLNKEGSELKIGDNFVVPSLVDISDKNDTKIKYSLIDTQIAYSQLNKYVYYSAPGSANYAKQSSLNSSLKFNMEKYGKYRFYVEFTTDSLSNNKTDSLELKADYLYEEMDGFYAYYYKENDLDEGTRLYYVKDEGLFYTSEENAKNKTGDTYEIDNEKVKRNKTCVIPIFTFELKNSGPIVKITSSYQENGYIGLTYKVSSITVSGSDTTTYTLLYKENADDDFETATETFDSSNMSFTPTKKGFYAVKVYAQDSIGANDTDTTADIEVTSKYVSVKYKTGFSEWLEMNTLPFVLLCVSAVCLIAILCLLFIPTKAPATSGEGKNAKKEKKDEIDR